MEVLYILVVVSVVVAILFLGAFVFAVRTGQFEDTSTPAMRILFDNKDTKLNKDT